MSQEKTTLEIIAPSVEEAVERGLSQLSISRDAVEIEVLDPGSHGFLGLGSRQARIRLKLKSAGTDVIDEQSQKELAPAAVVRPVIEKDKPVIPEPEEEGFVQDHKLQVAGQVVQELLTRMKVNAKVTAKYLEPSDDQDETVVMVEIQGDDLSILIGRRTETLNALQYISSLIIGKELGEWVPLTIDVQGYRARRDRQLRQLARRMADQAIHTGKRQVLEPMPANERRIIHMELHDHPQVHTESVGDEPNRKVTIILKK
jgi:spoIIIJ-associated protein